MCLPCIEPLINAWNRINPFKRARRRMNSKVEAERSQKEDLDRDNVNITFILEESRSEVTSDPLVPDNLLSPGPSKEVVVTMKKVSSLALV